MIADSIAFCRAAGQAAGLRRRALLRRLPRRRRPTRSNACGPPPRPGPRTSPSATPTAAACPTSSPRRPRPWSPTLGGAVEIGIHTHNDAECAVANSLAAVEAGARLVQGCVNGYGERCGNANLASILPALQLKMGFEVVSAEQLASLTPTSHYLDELCNMTPNPDRAYVGRNAFAHKAGMHAAGVAADARTFEHLDPALVGNERDILASELSGKATIRSQAERAGLELDDAAAQRRGRAAEGARAPRLPLRGGAGLLRAAAAARGRQSTSRSSSWRASASSPRSARAARSKPRRRSRSRSTASATSRWPRATARSTPSTRPCAAAIGARYPHLADDRADQLQGAHPRRGPRHRRRHPRPARLHRRRARVGHDRRLGEHHRGLLGGAGRLAGVRLPAEPRMSRRQIPLAQAGDRRPRGGAGARGAALGPALAGADGRALRARASPSGSGSRTRSPSPAAPPALHLGVRALGWGPGDEVLTSPFSFVASANCLLYEGARPVFCDVDPVTLNLDPAAAAAAVGERTAGILPVHIFGYPAAMPELEALAARHDLGMLEDACEALGAVDSEGRRVGARGNLATFAFYANKQMTTGEGGMVVPCDADGRRAPAQRAQPGPRRRHGLARPRRPRLQLPALRRRRRARRRPGREARRDAGRARARSRRSTRERPGGDRGRRGADRRPRRRAAQLVRLRRPPRRRRSTATRRSRAWPSAASPARPTCPASTSSRTCASSATARASSRSPKRPRRTRWRCPSSRR